MLFRKLSLHNFGQLAGDQTIDLQTQSTASGGAPIVLVGGHNGAGKTTILEALRLCLYGRLAFDTPISALDYQNHLASKIHRAKGAKNGPDTASVMLEFELTTQGHIDIYKIQRNWRRVPETINRVGENILIFKNGELLDDVAADYWQDFIQGLIPSSLSQLFFFDGEQIQRLANEETDTRALAAAVKALLGLEVVERLHTDLAIWAAKSEGRADEFRDLDELSESKTHAELEVELDRLRQERAQLANEIGRLKRDVELTERDLMQAGRGLFDDRKTLKSQQEELKVVAESIERQFQELCEAELPIVLCAQLCRQLQRQLVKEQELGRWQASRDHVRAFAAQVIKRGRSLSGAENSLEAIVSAALEDAEAPPADLRDVKIIHGFSSNASREIERWLDRALERIPGEVATLNRKLEKVQRELAKAQQALAQVPEEDTLKPLMERLFKTQQELAVLLSRDNEFDLAIADKVRLLAQAERVLSKIESRRKDMEAHETRLKYAARIQDALKTFQAHLTEKKLRSLESVFVETFNHLSRKLIVSRAAVDKENFVVELFDEDGRLLPKSQLSAGEKQIYAIAMLWSLAKISGRNLPVVIDTPLGRLDSIHRTHLVERYFPEAAHQVIILSTDTEIDQPYFEQLKPFIAKSYFLRHERGDGVTRVEERYFWREMTHA